MFGSLFAPKPQAPAPTPGSSMEQHTPPAPTPAPAPPASPLEPFKDLWKTDPTKQQAADPFASPMFATDPGKLKEAISSTDFLQSVPQDLMQKAMSGSDPQAFMQVINSVAQQSLSMALQLNTQLIEQSGQTLGKRFKEAIPTEFNSLQLKTTAPSNPILSNPAVEPMLQMVRQQMRMSNPDKSPSEINQLAEQYMMTFAQQLTGAGKPAEIGKSDAPNWENWV